MRATAATDAFSGGFPVRGGVFGSIATGTDGEVCFVDMWFRLCTWFKISLSSQSGADGAGVVTRAVNFGNAGSLAAIAIDYQNMPTTTDILIKADNTNGTTLFTGTSSRTRTSRLRSGSPGYGRGHQRLAATDGTEGANVFKQGLFFSVAEADAFTTGNELILIEGWVDD